MISTSAEKVISSPQEIMTPDYYILHWPEILPRYIGRGRPSKDTLQHYFYYIRQFIGWCAKKHRHPLGIHDYQMREYLEWLYGRNYKDDTIAIKLVAIRKFFSTAQKIDLIKHNPCADIYVANSTPDEMIRFFTPDQLYEICQLHEDSEDSKFRCCRNIAIIYLMSVEGIRTVEAHRMNREDIDWEMNSIFIHGKGRNRYIFPCEETMSKLKDYISLCPEKPKKDGPFTPVFLSDSNLNLWGRLSRTGIRFIINNILELAGFKKPGVSCHAFRHSAGTNLYAATKDLRLVQETLGHRDPKTTTRYAHLQERMTKRSTAAIIPKQKEG